MREEEPRPTKLKLDLAIAGIMLTLVLQFATAVWFASDINSRVHQLELDTAPLKMVPSDVKVLTSQLSDVKSGQDRIEHKLDNLENARK